MKNVFVLSALFGAMLIPALFSAEAEGKMPPPPPPPPRSPENFRRGPGLWQAFSRLGETEKQELMKLQRTDPDRFRTVMQQKADQLYQQELAYRRRIEALSKACREAGDPEKKAALKQELREEVKRDFTRHLQDFRRHVEAAKKRLARQEEELKKREVNSDKIIDAVTGDLIAGKNPLPPLPQPPPKHGERPHR